MGLAHPQEHATTKLHSFVAHETARRLALLPRVGRDDAPEERARRLEVVVVAVDTCLGEGPAVRPLAVSPAVRPLKPVSAPDLFPAPELLPRRPLCRPPSP